MYITRDINGKIIGAFANMQEPGQESISDDSQEAISFFMPPMHQNIDGFTQTVKSSLGGIVAANQLAISYPLFFSAVQSGIWEDVQMLIIDAKIKSVISSNQYDEIKSAAAKFNIPIIL